MAYLLDTGILLRLVDKKDRQHATVRDAVRILIQQREELLITTQNVAEFCNVASRPATHNGLGISPSETVDLLKRDIESICEVVAEIDAVYEVFKRLIEKYGVVGKQVHDARLVAMMLSWQIENILSLNDRDFRRYAPEGVSIATPTSLLTPGA